MSKKIVLLLAHPDSSGMCGRLAAAYEAGAKEGGHSVTRFNIGEMKFEPNLCQGYRCRQELEPDLIAFQQAVTACDHFVIVYPNWWQGLPAISKGLFDRAWLSGFAFRYYKIGAIRLPLWQRLMFGKTARVMVTTGTYPWLLRLVYGHFTMVISVGILWFAGFRVMESAFGPAETSTEDTKIKWANKAHRFGTMAR